MNIYDGQPPDWEDEVDDVEFLDLDFIIYVGVNC